jgi:hypothetical protein|eukprot:4340428-Prymnesium_polylepis.1
MAPSLAVFTLIRGGSSRADYESFISSRQCLRTMALPLYDDLAFHEGNVPAQMMLELANDV